MNPTEPNPVMPSLPRIATWEDWEAGRAARRALSSTLTAGQPLRRAAGNPRKDRLLRLLNQGQRGLPWADTPLA